MAETQEATEDAAETATIEECLMEAAKLAHPKIRGLALLCARQAIEIRRLSAIIKLNAPSL